MIPVGVMYQPDPACRRVPWSHRIGGSVTLIEFRLTTKPSPRARNIPARDAMNGCTSKYWTSTPTPRPMRAPVASIVGATTDDGSPCRSRLAPIIPVNDITAPTDRSMPPVRITNVMPTARISR
jgi:hypothetical protein